MAAEIEKLIERLQKATGPDRECDALIYRAIGRRVEELPTEHGTAYYLIKEGIGDEDWRKIPNYTLLPEPTKSIDAAMTLVPESFTRSVDATAPELDTDVDLHHKNHAKVIRGTHSSEAIATCIAALRALSHKGASND